MEDYRYTLAGLRRFNNPDVYRKTVEFQKFLKEHGVAWHNSFANECTIDFCCCEGDGKYNAYLPSYESMIKQFSHDLMKELEGCLDAKHKKLVQAKLETFRKNYFIGD